MIDCLRTQHARSGLLYSFGSLWLLLGLSSGGKLHFPVLSLLEYGDRMDSEGHAMEHTVSNRKAVMRNCCKEVVQEL